ncbi:MAG: hypothetical protein LBU32_16385 [Clostridiales bacterium]|jgi:FixJ family two-component response regulator|nr:hypothetical protein [Clostridiales bacterium]
MDGKEDNAEREGVVSDIGSPHETLERKDKHSVLVEFLGSLSDAEHLLMALAESGMKDEGIAAELKLKSRKSVYSRREALKAKILADEFLLEHYPWLRKYAGK